MKPLSEWTEGELRAEIDRCLGYSSDYVNKFITELLRRERESMRERCAKLCDQFGDDEGDEITRGGCVSDQLAREIRSLT
jgi:hypothetical protein